MVWVRRLAVLAIVALLGAACGQRPGVFRAVTAGGEGALLDEGSAAVDAESAAALDDAAAGEAGAGTGQTGPAGRGPGTAAAGANAPTQGLLRQGERPWGREITIGIHAPVTGAASLKADAFEAGRELYWRFLADRGQSIHGRSVKVKFVDDHYNPSTAATLCKQMVEGDNAFLLIGAAGADQIVECARYASSKGVPYLSAGVTEQVVKRLRNYFALSMSYPSQGPLLADHLKELERSDGVRPGTSQSDPSMRVALIVSDTPNFDDARDAFRAAFRQKFGRDVDYFKVVSKEGSQQEASQQATALRQWNNLAGIDVVYILSSVTFVVNLAASLDPQYRPRFVGIGITNVNQGVDLACANRAFDRAHYFSPFPAWVDRAQYDTDFDRAVQQQGQQGNNVPNGGDLMWTLWTLSSVIHKMLDAAGPNLTRSGFIQAMEAFRYAERKTYPDLAFTPKDHFGADTAHLLEARCETQGDSRGQFFTLRRAW